jgi:cyclic pyranopterin phosphate synthase
MSTSGSWIRHLLTWLRLSQIFSFASSLDTLDPFKFELITRRRGHSAVLKTLKQALSIPGLTVKLNMVVIRGLNDHEVLDFVELIKSSPLSVRMVEYMPFQGIHFFCSSRYSAE